MIMAALAIFQPWIRVGVGIGKFLFVLGGKNIFDTKITWSRSMPTNQEVCTSDVPLCALLRCALEM
jgi:hypothetical protein